jgi:hypothetical protein
MKIHFFSNLLNEKGGVKDGESSRQEVYLQEVWCGVHCHPGWKWDNLLLWSTDGIEEVILSDEKAVTEGNDESTWEKISLLGLWHGDALYEGGPRCGDLL